ncbi:hypothetical protein EI94DRAFT_1704649 [Lactarius quietus]|nr:hypothetical protein EI94DRAFT_1704649 [Lactarius quietus]
MQGKRDLRLVYFDGLSAAKYKDGTMDSQDVILWGRPNQTSVTQNGSASSTQDPIRLAWSTPNNEPRHLGGISRRKSARPLAGGDTRARLDYSGLVTFYDTNLTSLFEARYGKDVLHHRLEGISELDSERVRAELEAVLTREKDGWSGIDWGNVVRVITDRYADRLEYLRFLLLPNTPASDVLERAAAIHAQLLVMLAPCITTVDVPKLLPPSANLSKVTPITLRCATTHIPLDVLTLQEARTYAAVENTLHEICRRLVLVWLEFFDLEAADYARATEATEMARGHIEELMTWLDWRHCAPQEFCYFTSWPYFDEEDPFDLTPRRRSFESFLS